MQPLRQYIQKGGRRLRLGYTTGSCAAAAACAAAAYLLTGRFSPVVRLETPSGRVVPIAIETCIGGADGVRCTVIKDAGDDPDCTDGAEIGCTVSKEEAGFRVEGGEGVGRVTRPGLACGVGEWAINPVPRRMMEEQLSRQARQANYKGGLRAVVDVPDGQRLAEKTFNPRLGIEGGISILGTTGIVEPMSEAALVATIRAEMDSLRASGRDSLLLVPGNYGEAFARARWGITLDDGVKCSNFIGEALDYGAFCGFRKIVLVGHGGKLVKLAAGIMNTHSKMADGRMEILAAHAALQGMPPSALRQLMDCATIDTADDRLAAYGVAEAVWRSVGQKIRYHVSRRLGREDIAFACAVFGRRGVLWEDGEIGLSKEVGR